MKLLLGILAALTLSGCQSSTIQPPAEKAQQRDTVSAERSATNAPVVVRSEIGFAARRRFLEHYEKHGSEFGTISKEEYLRQAQILRDSPVGGNILETKRADGVITRFDRKSGAFLAFNPDLTIRTFFKPNDGERYFVRQSRERPRDE